MTEKPCCEDFLKEYVLSIQETRRLRGDQTEVFKILNRCEDIVRYCYVFPFKKDNRIRGIEVTLVNDQCRLEIRKYSLSQYVNGIDYIQIA